jgi:hypothetical protein
MDHLDEYLASGGINHKYDPAIRAALTIRKKTLNRYYNWTNHSELYQIMMSKCHSVLGKGPSILTIILVLYPCHKVSYFQCAGWMAEWVGAARKIIQDEFDSSYHFQEEVMLTIGPENTNKSSSVMNTNIFNSLPAFCTDNFGHLNKLIHYLCTSPKDVKNVDVLKW